MPSRYIEFYISLTIFPISGRMGTFKGQRPSGDGHRVSVLLLRSVEVKLMYMNTVSCTMGKPY